MIDNERQTMRETVQAGIDSLADDYLNVTVNMTTFITNLTGSIDIATRKALRIPSVPSDCLAWLQRNAAWIASGLDGSVLLGFQPGAKTLVAIDLRKRITLKQDAPVGDETEAEVAAEAEAYEPQYGWDPENPFGPRDSERYETIGSDPHAIDEAEPEAAFYPGGWSGNPNTWAPKQPEIEHKGGPLPEETQQLINVYVFNNDIVTYSADRNHGVDIPPSVYGKIVVAIKNATGMGYENAHVPKVNGRGGYWVVYAEHFNRNGIKGIRNAIRAGYARFHYNVAINTYWLDEEWLDRDLVS